MCEVEDVKNRLHYGYHLPMSTAAHVRKLILKVYTFSVNLLPIIIKSMFLMFLLHKPVKNPLETVCGPIFNHEYMNSS